MGLYQRRTLSFNKFSPVFRFFIAISAMTLIFLAHRIQMDAVVSLSAYAIFSASSLVLRKLKRHTLLDNKYLVICFDLLFITSIIMLTGYSASVFWPLYPAAIITFTITRGGFSGLAVALSSVFFYAWVIYQAEASLENFRPDFLTAVIFVTITAAFLVNKDKKATMKLVITDALTGAYNNRHFHYQMNRAVEHLDNTGKPSSLLFIDVDDFKGINDTFGHQQGDVILKTIVRAVKMAVRDNDMVFRYGGDEFAVLLKNTGKEDALMVAERIRENVGRFSGALPNLRKVTVSIGLAVLDKKLADKKKLMELADKSLYEAKRQGKNRVADCPHTAPDGARPQPNKVISG